MRVIADLHIHSPYSRATSPKLTPPYLDRWAQIKGLDLLGTGDCTHPRWLHELRDQFDDAENGMYTLRDSVRAEFKAGQAQGENFPPLSSAEKKIRFVLTGEISTIYKKGNKTRKIHHLVALPNFKAAGALQVKLEKIGNITSDGRPILGIDSRTLLAILLDIDEQSLLIPAHIWTPWFSVLGAKSGFDSIGECYEDLSPYITAIETGLSSNPPMNWSLSSLDGFAIISNSDAHSPEKLGREATLFDLKPEISFSALREALGLGREQKILETIEFFPQEGKYHYDGHRKCDVYLTPEETLAVKGLCPVCGKPLTPGVMSRVLALADRPVDETRPYIPGDSSSNRRPYCSLIPLKELLGELLGTGSGSKKVEIAYNQLLETYSELALLRDAPLEDIAKLRRADGIGELLAQGIARMRTGRVSITPGGDGEYGVIRAFLTKKDPKPAIRFQATPDPKEEEKPANKKKLDPEQDRAVKYEGNHGLIIAGPGAGKTAVLAARIGHLLRRGLDPRRILGLSFTVKAGLELRERIRQNAGAAALGVTVGTFHSFCGSVLREEHERLGLPADFSILTEEDQTEILETIAPKSRKPGLLRYIEARKHALLRPGEEKIPALPIEGAENLILAIPQRDEKKEEAEKKYQAALRSVHSLDFDDLITETVRLFAENPEILARWRDRYEALFVDEYQDVNFAQYVLLRLLGDSPEKKLWVIGDPNQAIYGFRGGDSRFMDRFLEDYPDAETFRLSRSFRCGESIVNAAGLLMEVRLQGTASGTQLFQTEYPTDKAEADGVARRIVRLIGGTSFHAFDAGLAGRDEPELTGLNECAILLRTLHLAEPFIRALKTYGLPYRLSGEFDTKALLAALGNSPEKKPAAALAEAWSRLGQKTLPEGLSNMASLYDTLPDFLEALTFAFADESLTFDPEGVRIMTIHASKGLEFEQVFVPALEEGLMPFTLYDSGSARLEEEKRLLYVAMTRAKSGLYLSYAKKRFFQNRILDYGRSRFFDILETAVPSEERPKRKASDPQILLF
ncbi:MAG: UvrD-helicase domain-containing protein [Spirochaetaceae bacterium]|jgi:uncharacterized protein (TIGR00375 family)|nr:UvrD-helicase domain-containing protein [Spirochaetaceae bacterium]